MRRDVLIKLLVGCAFALALFPGQAMAGGTEYAADGTRGLGRGGATMARADDPRIMVRNPALLADLWDSMLYLSTDFNYASACSQPSGGYGWGEGESNQVLLLDADEGPVYPAAREGAAGGTDPDNLSPLKGYLYEPYPEICHQGGSEITPAVGLTTKWGEKLGVGIGFMPPEVGATWQMGNREGTVDTPDGLRPNPLRYMGSHRNVTYFGLLGALGYRVAPWLRLGLGLRWSVAMADATEWNKYGTNDLRPTDDVRVEYHGYDAFVPGFTASIHLVPIDALDLAVGFNWQDYLRFDNAKLDMMADPFGPGEPFYYQGEPGGEVEAVSTGLPYVNQNVPGELRAPPASVPQLSAGIRFADRIKPRPEKYTGLQRWSDPVRDPMADERWDIELDWIYFFNSYFDTQDFYFSKDQRITRVSVGTDGKLATMAGPPSGCSVETDADGNCPERYVMPTDFGGVDQMSVRLGGDYNVITSVLALRAGVSYEGRGADPSYARPNEALPFERLGVHGGFTWRIDGRTDFSFAYAHFFQETISLAVNDEAGGGIDTFLTEARTFYKAAKKKTEGMTDEQAEQAIKEMYNVVDPDDADGYAKQRGGDDGFYFINAGTHKYNLDVWGVSIARHF